MNRVIESSRIDRLQSIAGQEPSNDECFKRLLVDRVNVVYKLSTCCDLCNFVYQCALSIL